jgi:hypothetical protein
MKDSRAVVDSWDSLERAEGPQEPWRRLREGKQTLSRRQKKRLLLSFAAVALVTIFCGLTGQWIFFWIGGVLLAVMSVVILLGWAATPLTPTAEEKAETSGEAETPD